MSSPKRDWDIIGLVHFGLFLIVVGLLFLVYPNLFGSLKDFFMDFEMVEVADNFFIPVVSGIYPEVYGAFFMLGVAMVIIEVLIMVARFLFRDTVRRRAESISGIVFWSGISVLAYQLREGLVGFPAVYSLFAIIAGASVISTGVGIILARWTTKREAAR